MATAQSHRPKRLLALDVMRGITIAGMILVNNPGSWGDVYAPLRHASWNGLTPTDLVFPFFMFIMGLSTYLSLKKFDFRLSWPVFYKVMRRSVLLFLIGMAIAWFSMFMRGIFSDATLAEAVFTFDRIRILGVIPRLAICYGVGAFLALLLSRRALIWTVALMLIAYAVMLVCGNGYAFADDNIIAVVDRAVLGEAHMYTDWVYGVSLKFDPEGFLSTLPSIAHMLIGFLCGGMIMSVKNDTQRVNRLFIVGTVLTFAGLLLSYGLPLNKKVWSPTFVLTTCGLASSLLALLIWVIDMRGHVKWSRFFVVFGVNPLFLYCLSTVLAVTFGVVKFPYGDGLISIKGFIYKICIEPLCCGNAVFASLCFALFFVLLNWCIGLVLYKKKIYIKL